MEDKRPKSRFNVDCSHSTKGLFMGIIALLYQGGRCGEVIGAGLFFVVLTLIGMIIFFVNVITAQDKAALTILYASDILHYTFSIAVCLYGSLPFPLPPSLPPLRDPIGVEGCTRCGSSPSSPTTSPSSSSTTSVPSPSSG